MKIEKCRCGKYPDFDTFPSLVGHGDYDEQIFLVCDCGMRTKGFSLGWDGSKEECKEKCAKIWNGET